MPTIPQMTWVGRQKRWTKGYRGKMYSVSCKQLNCEPTKEASAIPANRWWAQKQAELDSANQPDVIEVATDRVKNALDGLNLNELRELIDRATNAKFLLAALTERAETGQVGKGPILSELMNQGISGAANALKPKAETSDRSVSAQAEKWIDLLTGAGIKAGSVRNYRFGIRPLVKFLGADTDIGEITAVRLEEYFGFLAKRITDKELSPTTASERMKHARQFVARLAELGLIQAPGNLHSRRLKFNTPAKEVPTIPDAEIKAILEQAEGMTKAIALLCLNCGMTQVDVAELTQAEVDWTSGTITRQRSKRQGKAGALTIKYPLWPETLAALKPYRSEKEKRVFSTKNGKPLMHRWNEGKKCRSYDTIRKRWQNACKQAGVPEHPVKLLRKTAASKLAEHPVYRYFTQYFLGHSPRSLQEKHYVKPHQDSFNEAINWLKSAWL